MASSERDEERRWLENLPKAICCGMTLRQWKGFWLPEPGMRALRRMETGFSPLPGDIIITSFPRTGTTWLMALTFAVLHRRLQKPGEEEDDDPLQNCNPHELIPSLEYRVYRDTAAPDLAKWTQFRIFQTHLSYSQLPNPVKESGCKIVYIARNPKDTLVSFWHYWNSNPMRPRVTLEELFDAFCRGTVVHGPFPEHVLGYWREREKVFFTTYEELRRDPEEEVRKLARVLGQSLSSAEIKGIVRRCSFDRLSSAKANAGERADYFGFPFSSYFRKGEVGEWKSHLTEAMAHRIDEITRKKLEVSGFNFLEMNEKGD